MLFDFSNIAVEATPILIGLALKGALLLAGVLAVVTLFNRANAAVRHAVLTTGLVGAVLLPLLLVTVPPLNVALLCNNSTAGPELVADVETASGLHVDEVENHRPVTSGIMLDHGVATDTAGPVWGEEDGFLEHVATSFGAVRSPDDARAALASTWVKTRALLVVGLPDWRISVFLIWLLGAMLVTVRWLAALISARELLRDAAAITDAEWQRAARAAANRMGIEGEIRLLKSERLAVPVVWCFGRAAVILPADCDEWSPQRRQVVLEHEFAHVARYDGVTQMLGQVAVALHWFNPLAWQCYAASLMERERAADDLVLAGGTRASDYAGHLLHIADRYRPEPLALLAVAAMARNASLTHRIEMILDPRQRRGSLNRAHTAVVAFLAAVVLIPLAAFSPFASPSADEQNPMQPAAIDSATQVHSATSDDWRWQGTAAAGELVEVYGINGAISVREGSGNTVSVVGTPRGRNADRARLEVNDVPGGVVICVIYPGQSGCAPGRGPSGRNVNTNNATVNLDVVLPSRVRVKARTTNGAIRTDHLNAAVEVQTTNGSVDTGSRTGDVRAVSTNGAITLTAGGRVEARTTNGSITITAPGPVDATTTNGTIDVNFLRTEWNGSSRLSTTNGGLRVELPARASVTIDANASNSSIRTDFGEIDVRSTRRNGPGATARGTIGAGGRTLELRTTNGGIRISRDTGSASRHPGDHQGYAGSFNSSVSADLDIELRGLDSIAALENVASADLAGWADALGSEMAALSHEVGVTVAEAMAGIDWESISSKVSLSLEDAGTDIRSEVLEAIEEVRRELRHEREQRRVSR